ncbi:DUF2637 domain-containing protein [Streptomyces nigrescens]|uniref:DUF2637 domain-containing protein n=1 Tax=Streptomyces nigrescens TaxID=1920 RepID=UPI0036FB895D
MTDGPTMLAEPLPSAAAIENDGLPTLNRPQRAIVGVVIAGAVVIAAIGFAGSYMAVRDLALAKGFGQFATAFPLGVDVGILVLQALDLLLTWLRMPFPLLRQTAWLLTAATIAFNGAASWPDPLGIAMHAVIPLLFVMTVEAARHAVGRLASITAGRHMESVRFVRWLLAPAATFLLWRRMNLYEIRSYDKAIQREIDRLIYRARLRARFGRAWRRKAPVAQRLPLRLARYGVPLGQVPQLDFGEADGEVPLDLHVATALEITSASTADDRSAEIGESAPLPSGSAEECAVPSVNGPVNGSGDEGVKSEPSPTVNDALKRECPAVNSDCVNGVKPSVKHIERCTGGIHDLLGGHAGRCKQASRVNVNVNCAEQEGASHTPAFTVTVNRLSVDVPVKEPVNDSCPRVKHGAFTREVHSVNRSVEIVNRPLLLPVNVAVKRELAGVNVHGKSVNQVLAEAVNDPLPDREEAPVNGAGGPPDDVNQLGVNGIGARRARPAEQHRPGSVHARVGQPTKFQRERAEAAEEYFRAKKDNPDLTQRAFAEDWGKSEGWLTKALQEAREGECVTANRQEP